MGAQLHLLVATVCVAALVGPSRGQSHCNEASWGIISGTPYSLDPIPLQSGVRDWRITITPPAECFGTVSGVSVRACDYDTAPQLNFINQALVYIHRTGNLEFAASASAIVYCPGVFARAEEKHSPQFVTNVWDKTNSYGATASKGSGLIATPN